MGCPTQADAAPRGVVLAGGASTRMGRDKATLAVDGIAMARRVADALVAGGCRDVIAVGGDRAGLAAIGLHVVDDRWPGEGPLGGILTALRATGTRTVVAACDLPWLDAATIGALVARGALDGHVDAVVAETDRLEPLCALWSPRAVPALERRWAAGERAVHRALARLQISTVRVQADALRNVNTPSDLL